MATVATVCGPCSSRNKPSEDDNGAWPHRALRRTARADLDELLLAPEERLDRWESLVDANGEARADIAENTADTARFVAELPALSKARGQGPGRPPPTKPKTSRPASTNLAALGAEFDELRPALEDPSDLARYVLAAEALGEIAGATSFGVEDLRKRTASLDESRFLVVTRLERVPTYYVRIQNWSWTSSTSGDGTVTDLGWSEVDYETYKLAANSTDGVVIESTGSESSSGTSTEITDWDVGFTTFATTVERNGVQEGEEQRSEVDADTFWDLYTVATALDERFPGEGVIVESITAGADEDGIPYEVDLSTRFLAEQKHEGQYHDEILYSPTPDGSLMALVGHPEFGSWQGETWAWTDEFAAYARSGRMVLSEAGRRQLDGVTKAEHGAYSEWRSEVGWDQQYDEKGHYRLFIFRMGSYRDPRPARQHLPARRRSRSPLPRPRWGQVSQRAAILALAVFATGFSGLMAEYSVSTVVGYLTGNTIAAYSILIGVFMASMGLGALGSERLDEGSELGRYLAVELALSAVVAASTVIISRAAVYDLTWPAALVVAVLIGLLIGFEIPLLLRFNDQREVVLKKNVAWVLGADYLGAFVAALAFVGWCLPTLGTVGTPVLAGAVNLVVAGARVDQLPRGALPALGPRSGTRRLLRVRRGPVRRAGRGGLRAAPVRRPHRIQRADPVPAHRAHPLQGQPLPVPQRADADVHLRRAPLPRGPRAPGDVDSAQGAAGAGARRRGRTRCARAAQVRGHARGDPRGPGRAHHRARPDPGAPARGQTRTPCPTRGSRSSPPTASPGWPSPPSCSTSSSWTSRIPGTWRWPSSTAASSTRPCARTSPPKASWSPSPPRPSTPAKPSPSSGTPSTRRASSPCPTRVNVPTFGDWGFNIAVREGHLDRDELRERLDGFEPPVQTRFLNNEAMMAATRFEKGIFPEDPDALPVSRLIRPSVYEAYQRAWTRMD